MRATARQEANVLTLDFELEPHDRSTIVAPNGKVKARFLGGLCRYMLPDGWKLSDVHPDLIACVAITIAGRFALREFTLPFPISEHFRERLSRVYKAQLGPVDPALPPRRAPRDGRLGLCFSGGVDSTAAVILLPRETAVVFLERIERPGQSSKSMYKKDAAVRATEVLRQCGRDALSVQTDMEYTRDPVGFMNDGTMATPLMLLADWLRLDGIAYGLIFESSYLNKGFKFREYKQIDHWKRYGGDAAACDLPWHLITAGLSEVVTSRLVLESPFQQIAQSCIRGTFGQPCMDCWKCFRKSLLEAALLGEPVPSALLDKYFQMREAAKKLKEVPIKHENVMMYILQKYRGSNRHMLDLHRELGVEGLDLDWMERWFTDSREVLSERYAQHGEAAITQLMEPMTARDIANVRAWDRLAANEAAGRLMPAGA